MRALTDFHADDDHDDKAAGKNFLEHEAESIIDELLEKHDRNEDGYIDYVELMNTKIDSLMTELDKPDPNDQQKQQWQQILAVVYVFADSFMIWLNTIFTIIRFYTSLSTLSSKFVWLQPRPAPVPSL